MFPNLISKFPAESQTFIASVASSGVSRSLSFSIAAARSISNRLPFPSSRLSDLENYYAMTLKLESYGSIDFINEILCIDTEKVSELTQDFYFLRYENAYPGQTFFATRDNPLAGFFSMQKYLSDLVITDISENPGKIMVYVNEVTKLLNAYATVQ